MARADLLLLLLDADLELARPPRLEVAGAAHPIAVGVSGVVGEDDRAPVTGAQVGKPGQQALEFGLFVLVGVAFDPHERVEDDCDGLDLGDCVLDARSPGDVFAEANAGVARDVQRGEVRAGLCVAAREFRKPSAGVAVRALLKDDDDGAAALDVVNAEAGRPVKIARASSAMTQLLPDLA